MINDMLDELDLYKVAEIADKVMEKSTYAMCGGVFFAFLTLIILAILVLLLLRTGKATKTQCSCSQGETPTSDNAIGPSPPPKTPSLDGEDGQSLTLPFVGASE